MVIKNFIHIVVCSTLFAHMHLHTAEQDIENPAVIQLNNQETTADRQDRLSSARHAFIGSGINFFTGAFQYYTLSACHEVCNESFKGMFNVFLSTGLTLTGAVGAAAGGVAFVDWCVDQQTPSYFSSKLRNLSLSGLSLCASFSCGMAALNNPNHFAIINGSGVATVFGTGAYLFYKGVRLSGQKPPRINLIEDLLEPEAQV